MLKGLIFVALFATVSCASRQVGKNQFVIEKRWVRSTLKAEYLAARRIHRFTPIISESMVIAANSIDGILAYDRKSAKVLWRMDILDGVEGGAYLVDGLLYFGSGDGQFYALNPSTGAVVWTYPLRAIGLARPLVKGGVVYVLAGNNVLHSLNAKTGKLNWVYNRRDASNLSIRGGSQPAISGENVFVGLSDGSFVALNSRSGSVVWEVNLNKNNRFKDVDAAPIVDEDRIFVSAYDGSLYCLSKSDGRIIWSVEEGGYDDALVIGSNLYYATTSNKLMAIEKKSGKVSWTRNLSSLGTGPVSFKGTIVVGESAGALKFFDANSGDLISSFEPGRGVSSRASVDSNTGEVYFISVDAVIYALDAKWKRYAKDWPWEL